MLGTVNTAGSLTVIAVGITQGGTGINASGDASFDAGAGEINLSNPNNEFAGSVSLNNTGPNNVTITDATAFAIGAWSLGNGSLTVTAGAAGGVAGITQTSAIAQAAGAPGATFIGNNGSIILNNASNDFVGPLSLSVTDTSPIEITESTALELVTILAGGNLTVTAGGAVTKSTGATVAGETTINASGFDITLNQATNNLTGAVSLFGDDVAVTNAGSLLLGPGNATGTYNATAVTGDIDQV